jgi:hypothetical protein
MNHQDIRIATRLDLKAPAPGVLPAQFSGVAYSGEKVPALGVVIDVGSTSVPEKMPLLIEHDRGRIAGVVNAATATAGTITVSGKLFSDMEGSDAQRIAQLASRGAVYQLSIGLYGFTEHIVGQGQGIEVNGRRFDGPLVVLRQGKVRETSLVVLGADHQSTVAMFGSPAKVPASLDPRSVYAKRARDAAACRR